MEGGTKKGWPFCLGLAEELQLQVVSLDSSMGEGVLKLQN